MPKSIIQQVVKAFGTNVLAVNTEEQPEGTMVNILLRKPTPRGAKKTAKEQKA